MFMRRGFTLIELLVVIAIIAILSGIVLAGVSSLQRTTKIAKTVDLMTSVTSVIDRHLSAHQRLGDITSGDFLADPWDLFFKKQSKLKQIPYLDIPLSGLVKKVGSGACIGAESKQVATHIVDSFGANAANVLSFTIKNISKGNGDAFYYAHYIFLRSSAGTFGDPKDDLIYAYSYEKASWRKLRNSEVVDFANELDPVPTLTEITDLQKFSDPLK